MNRQAAKQAPPQFWWLAGASAAVAIGFAVFASGSVRSNSLRETTLVQAIGGDPQRAVPAMIRNGCGGCHEIPGVPGARGTVGPSLQGVVERGYIGASRASPDAMMRWISRARDVDPNTAMPNTNLSPQEARDITAYLYART
ncbi:MULTISPECIES: c-type cytochrome [unclassified Mesorhizobium]|uniref:c-type cytochrome n=1 Tax=unclassified Mesorhizobium TaxID=325217 RepID=UPI000FCBDD88|nr:MULTISPECIES: c-type cytochrome [unclassified Mesorhizobium]RUZ90694.1 c-type cytochrome [Mesorhizobium sp. M7A.F.Ca.US.003.02.2.1]RUZ01628.1 c-type cytochrome [Mesorhizobium sp. M7A.F.Ca.CA.001.12.2.1]RUZ26872.1 c-type cytochrome [Mesorhizobium sp. M7A.F.Ca.US.007.01.2.1]RUZ49617.1 c-type cytochrome [Mesorhizobium sp. M7A.F.Ca.US.003.02.1.1]RUZ69829.1 c-type cytochrome [Mesorhizobium sp. M7A.F.Ca.US.007.01.1.1]